MTTRRRIVKALRRVGWVRWAVWTKTVLLTACVLLAPVLIARSVLGRWSWSVTRMEPAAPAPLRASALQLDPIASPNLAAGTVGLFAKPGAAGLPWWRNTNGTDSVFLIGDTVVTPGSYTNASITVDQQGRLTAASSGAPATTTFVQAMYMNNWSSTTNATFFTPNNDVNQVSQDRPWITPTACTLQNFRISQSQALGGAAGADYTVLKNGVATTITCAVTTVTTGCTDLTHTVAVVAGDTFSAQVKGQVGINGNPGRITGTVLCK